MESKKTLKISTAVCDVRNVTEELLSSYEKVEISAANIITSQAAQALLGKYAAKLSCARTTPLEGNVRFAQFNGSMEITPSQAVSEEKTCLMINGSLDIEAGSEEALQNYAAIIVNGSVTCPSSIKDILGNTLTVNGSLTTYPDGCIRLKNSAVLDRFFHLRAKQDAFYYAGRRVVALSPDINFDKLAEKNVRFATKKLLVSESLAETAVPFFDEKVDIVVLPDGCSYVDDDVELDETLLKRYGGKLYIAGDLTIGARAAGLLDQVSFLRVNGDLLVARSLKDRVLGMDVEYDGLHVVGGSLLTGWASQTITAYMLENAEDGLSAMNCAHISIAEDVTPELLREKLVSIIGCASVSCATLEQMDVIGLLARDVASLTLDNQDDEEDDDKPAEDENIVKISAAFYAL